MSPLLPVRIAFCDYLYMDFRLVESGDGGRFDDLKRDGCFKGESIRIDYLSVNLCYFIIFLRYLQLN